MSRVGVARGQHQDGRAVALAPQAPGHVEPAEPGQHDVEHDDVEGRGLGQRQAVGPRVRHIHGVAFLREALPQDLRHLPLVFDNQDSHRASRLSWPREPESRHETGALQAFFRFVWSTEGPTRLAAERAAPPTHGGVHESSFACSCCSPVCAGLRARLWPMAPDRQAGPPRPRTRRQAAAGPFSRRSAKPIRTPPSRTRQRRRRTARPCGKSRASTTASRETWSTTRMAPSSRFEEQIVPASLPAAVSAALKAKYPKATITKAEKLMKGTTLTYEMALKGAAVKYARGRLPREGRDGSRREEGRSSHHENARLRWRDRHGAGPRSGGRRPYKQLAEIKVGGDGGWDYLAVDSAARRLYVSHATKVVVIDLDKNAVVGEIAPAPGVHGIAIAPELGKGFVSNGRENSASIVDLKTLQITGSVKTGENPDCILYEPGHKEVYTFNGRGKSRDGVRRRDRRGEGHHRAARQARVRRRRREGRPHLQQHRGHERDRRHRHGDPRGGGQVAHRAGRRRVGAGDRPRATTGCSPWPATSSWWRSTARTGKVLSTLPIGPGVDAAAYDPATGFVFASSSDSTLTVAKADAAGKLSLVQTLATPRAVEDDDARPEDASDLHVGSRVHRPAARGGRRPAPAPADGAGLVQGRGVRDDRSANQVECSGAVRLPPDGPPAGRSAASHAELQGDVMTRRSRRAHVCPDGRSRAAGPADRRGGRPEARGEWQQASLSAPAIWPPSARTRT